MTVHSLRIGEVIPPTRAAAAAPTMNDPTPLTATSGDRGNPAPRPESSVGVAPLARLPARPTGD
jgi:hypothetical protein